MSNYMDIFNKVKERHKSKGLELKKDSDSNSQLLEELKELEGMFGSESGITEAPEAVDAKKLEEPTTTKEDIEKQVFAELESKYGKQKSEMERNLNVKSQNLEEQKLTEQNSNSSKVKGINSIYDDYAKSAENQALKRGLARSSIIIGQLDGIESQRANTLASNLKEYESNLANIEKEILSLQNSLQEELGLMELEKASETQNLIQTRVQDLEKTRKEITEFNNKVNQMEAEFKLKKNKQDFEQKFDALEFQEKYGEENLNNKVVQEQYDLIYSTLAEMGRDEALKELLSSTNYAYYLGDKFYDMYYNLSRLPS